MNPSEIARRGDEIYEKRVRTQVEPGNAGKIVAVDVNTEAYAVGQTAVEASKKLREQHPNAEIWFVRIGDRALHRIGSCPASEKA